MVLNLSIHYSHQKLISNAITEKKYMYVQTCIMGGQFEPFLHKFVCLWKTYLLHVPLSLTEENYNFISTVTRYNMYSMPWSYPALCHCYETPKPHSVRQLMETEVDIFIADIHCSKHASVYLCWLYHTLNMITRLMHHTLTSQWIHILRGLSNVSVILRLF